MPWPNVLPRKSVTRETCERRVGSATAPRQTDACVRCKRPVPVHRHLRYTSKPRKVSRLAEIRTPSQASSDRAMKIARLIFCWFASAMNMPRRLKTLAGQESVWDYPRPPRLEKVGSRLRVILNRQTIADTASGHRVLETSHPPVYYIPPVDIDQRYLRAAAGTSWCEFKGLAKYWSLDVDGRHAENAAWGYPNPSPAFAAIAGHLAFYASRVDECWVDDERVQPQQGDFYGGWITSRIVGPFKGGVGTQGW